MLTESVKLGQSRKPQAALATHILKASMCSGLNLHRQST